MTMIAMSNTYTLTGRSNALGGFVMLCARQTVPVIIS